MDENDIKKISNGLKQRPGYVAEGELATFKIIPVEVSQGGASVYLVVWRKVDGEPLFLTLLPAGKWNESLMDELMKKLTQAVQAGNEQEIQKQLSEVGQFIRNLTGEQDAINN